MVTTKVKKLRNGPTIVKSVMDGKTKFFVLDSKFSPNQKGYTLRNSSGNIITFKTAAAAEKAVKKRQR